MQGYFAVASGDDIRSSLRDLLVELQENRKAINAQLDALNKKVDLMPDKVEFLRREMLTVFISRSEYDPKHQILVDKQARYDRLLDERAKLDQAFVELKSTVEQQSKEIKANTERSASSSVRIIQFTAIVVAVAGFLLNLFQHIHFS
jgi:chromosome segregation ATPase